METKFSIIVPVYNVEKYIIKCLKSLLKQNYSSYEIIIVDDGSTDNSSELIKKFIKNKQNIKYFVKQNGGLSDARNFGVKKATGDYILFVDSDDFINEKLLYKLNLELEKNIVDIVKFNLDIITPDKEIKHFKKSNFSNIEVNEAIDKILKDEFVEPAVLYCYNRNFWNANNFKYSEDRYHEDFGLTPLILMEAKTISSIDYIGYNYVIRENSIMTTNDDIKAIKKFNDCLYFFDENITKIEKNTNIEKNTKEILFSYYANGLISKSKQLKGQNFEAAIIELKKRKVSDYLISDNFKRIIKKYIFKLFPKIYIKGLMR